jgi:mannose-6-phosphate isomerase-like protein (cupin superfamily)
MTGREPIVRLRGEGEEFKFAIASVLRKFTGEETEGRVSAVELLLEAHHSGPPLHTDDHDEIFVVQTGVLRLRVGDAEFDAPMGSVLLVPTGVPHTFANRGSHDVRMLALFSPAGFERYFEEVARELPPATPADPAKLGPIAAKYGLQTVGPPLEAS